MVEGGKATEGILADPLPDAVFRELLDAAPDAILCVDADGRIAIANAQAERLFGYSKSELVGTDVDLLVPPAARAAHARHRAGYLREPHPRPIGVGMQLAARRKNGSEFQAEISLSALDTDQGMLVSAAVRDVTDRLEARAEHERLEAVAERERLELQLAEAQRLESLGQLAGGVAHDFNNLLGVILNFAAFVGESLDELFPDEHAVARDGIRSDVDQIVRAAERAADLTRQLLSFARREVLRPTVLDLNEVVEDVEHLLVHTLGEHVDLSTELRPELWPVLADPGRLQQVLVNLAVNARDAMPSGGTLRIDTENVVADDAYTARHAGIAPGRYVRVRVSDTGHGMDEATRARAFDPFYTTKPRGQGTGLGLATVYGIITQAGGHVHIYSEPGLGTTITALLPATETAERAAEPAPSSITSPGGETVLVVEDEDPLREVTCRVLVRSGYRVLSAANGIEALEIARAADEIHLLLTDVVMPQMAGPQLAEMLTAERPHVRVLFMSGYARPVLATGDHLDPDIRLIEKPFSGPVLLETVRSVLDRALERGTR